MKKSLIALAVLAASGAALAQSSVTLFGLVDATVRYVDADKGGSNWQMTNSGLYGSRLGFRGTEDLGGGLNASFWLEAGLNNDNGAGASTSTNNSASTSLAGAAGSQGLTFNRRSTVSLASTWGELRLGRDAIPSYVSIVTFDPFNSQGVGTSALFSLAGLSLLTGGGLNLNAGAIRASNSIGYFMPNIAGFYGQAMYAMGEQNNTSTGATAATTNCATNPSLAGSSNACKSNGNVAGVRVGYANGPVNIAYAWSATTFLPSEQYQAMNLGASWNFGMIMPRFLWNQEKALNKTANSYMIGATAPIGAGEVKAAYTWGSSTNNQLDGSMISLGYVYNLSKRTALYTTGSYISNSGVTTSASSLGKTYNYSLAGGPVPVPQIGGNTWGMDFGLKHSF